MQVFDDSLPMMDTVVSIIQSKEGHIWLDLKEFHLSGLKLLWSIYRYDFSA